MLTNSLGQPVLTRTDMLQAALHHRSWGWSVSQLTESGQPEDVPISPAA